MAGSMSSPGKQKRIQIESNNQSHLAAFQIATADLSSMTCPGFPSDCYTDCPKSAIETVSQAIWHAQQGEVELLRGSQGFSAVASLSRTPGPFDLRGTRPATSAIFLMIAQRSKPSVVDAFADARCQDGGEDMKAEKTVEYDGPSGGWGSLGGLTRIFGKEWDSPAAIDTLMRQNKPKVSCASRARGLSRPTITSSSSARMGPRLRCGSLPPDGSRRTSSPSIPSPSCETGTTTTLSRRGAHRSAPLRFGHRQICSLRVG